MRLLNRERRSICPSWGTRATGDISAVTPHMSRLTTAGRETVIERRRAHSLKSSKKNIRQILELPCRMPLASPTALRISGVKMDKAWNPDTGKLVTAEQIHGQRGSWPRLYCQFHIENGCSARVCAVDPNRTETRRAAAPHFRTNRSSKKFGNNAHRGCLFDLDKRIEVLVSESAGLLTFERVPGRGRRGVFRVSLPRAFLPAMTSSGRVDPSDRTFTEVPTPLLNTAVRIAELLDDLQTSGASLNRDVVLTCGGLVIDWNNFLYTPNRHWVLGDRLRRELIPAHPIAVIIYPERPREPQRWAMSRAGVPEGHHTRHGPDGAVETRIDHEVLFVRGAAPLIRASLADSHGALRREPFIAFGMWTAPEVDPRGVPRAGLHLVDDRQVAPLPANVTPRVLRLWQEGRPSQD